MKKEQLDKINCLLNQIAEMEKILAIKGNRIDILEHGGCQFLCHGVSVNIFTIHLETLVPILKERIIQSKIELKELGYEE